MANAAVLKTADRKVLQVRILCPPLRALLSGLTALVIAALLLPATARPICACTIKGPAYRAAMRSDLRNLVAAQETFRADSGRYATVAELVATGQFMFSTSVHVAESTVSDGAFTVRLRHESLSPEMTCAGSVGDAAPPDGEPVCASFPRERSHVRNGIFFFALLALGLVLRVRQAVFETHRFYSWRLLLLPTLALAHPFWDVIRGQVRDHCFLGDYDLLWMGAAIATAFYLFVGPERPAEGSAPPAVA
jgi:hypothetical protein